MRAYLQSRSTDIKSLRDFIFLLILSLILLVLPHDVNTSTPPSISGPDKGPISEILSVTAKDSKSGTAVNILGNGRVLDYVARTLDSPPRIIVDILNAAPSFESMTIPVKSMNLKSVRVGSHPTKIRLVLDIKGPDIPIFTTMAVKNTLTIFLRAREPIDKETGGSDQIRRTRPDKETPVAKKTIQVKTHTPQPQHSRDSGMGGQDEKPPLPKGVNASKRQNGSGTTQYPKKTGESDQIRHIRPDKETPSIEQTIQVKADNGQDDTSLILNGYNAYRNQDWSGAIENLSHLIKRYPSGRYSENAYFLLAKSYEQLYSHAISTHFTKIKGHYEDAINRFPTSAYVPEALLAIGNLCFKAKNYFEAFGYYNFLIKKHKDSIMAMKALLQKAEIFFLKKKMGEAVSTLEHIIHKYPGSPEEREIKVKVSKILYETNNFQKSLNLLSELIKTNPKIIHQIPEISLYLGYNYEQLGDMAKAREHFFRFFNSSPDREGNDLILTKIGDTYRDEGLIGDAVKLYQLVLERYLETEGALISQFRLAEQQEEGKLETKRGISSPVRIIDKVIGLPREIYEDIMNNFFKKDKENPLAQLALLKLAILYQREKEHDKSLKAIKELLEKYPWESLKKESRHTLTKTLTAILRDELKKRKFITVMNIYQKEKELFSMINSPEPFLVIARASMYLNLEDTAKEMFKRADSLLLDNEKPPDLLFFVSRDLFKNEGLKGALTRLNLLIDSYPSHKYTPDAYYLKGKILFKQKEYPQAVEMFSSALRFDPRRCKRARLLVDKAKALVEGNLKEKALMATREAKDLRGDCILYYQHIYEEMGDLYLRLGYPEEALTLFNDALKWQKEEENQLMLKLKIAQCYRSLDKKEDYLALYKEISGLDNPFWSNLSKERVEEIKFHTDMEKQKKVTKKRR